MPGEAQYPPDHQPGMAVSKGGSCCADCKYLKDEARRICGNEYFIEWKGSNVIPGEIDAYCSDWWEPGPDRRGSWKRMAR